ncbi:MAG: hypothetical protein FVQ81_11505 [Candidatus Glassbacteria bacterium]|nr:hypothetical protein [Candidatus Glassbacteria bacterium]
MLFPRQILCLIGVVLLGACQTSGPPALSLEEAKKVTAQFAGSFTPPPKSIGGIRELVRQGVPQTWSCESSVDVTEETLAGMMEGMPDKPGRDGRANFAASSASREFQRGNFQRAIRFMEMAIFSTSNRERLIRFERLALFAPVYRVRTPPRARRPFTIPPTGNSDWFRKGWAWDTTSVQKPHAIPDPKDRSQEGYYSIFQIDHLDLILNSMSLQVEMDSFLESSKTDEIDWNANGKRWLQYTTNRANGLRDHEYRRSKLKMSC